VKATRAKRITDTVFFKHKYITQPTVTPADSIVNAYHNLAKALQGIQNSKDDAHIEALKRLEDTLNPGYNQVIEKYQVQRPRVEEQQVRNPEPTFEPTFDHRPRVSFEPTLSESTGGNDKPSRLVVASPKKAIVVS
jgi:hypothetical protein